MWAGFESVEGDKVYPGGIGVGSKSDLGFQCHLPISPPADMMTFAWLWLRPLEVASENTLFGPVPVIAPTPTMRIDRKTARIHHLTLACYLGISILNC